MVDNNDIPALKVKLYSSVGIMIGGQNKLCLAIVAVVAAVAIEAVVVVNIGVVVTAVAAVFAKVCFWGALQTNKSDPIAFELALSELYTAIDSTK